MLTTGCLTLDHTLVRSIARHNSHIVVPLVKRSIVRPSWQGTKLARHRPSSCLSQTTVQPDTEESPGLGTDEPELAYWAASKGTQPISWTARWWPVTALDSLEPKIPQHVDLLGKSLVVWADSKGQWHCLEDKCPHRLAPLSEGRVEGDTLMCSYHGWTFNSSGACTNIPQLDHDPKAKAAACSSKRSCTRAYPAQPAHGLLWVWPEAGPEAEARAASTPAGGEVSWGPEIPYSERTPWYVRHVPMRYDMLMENFLDPTHVPFSHHGVAMANRNKPFTVKIWATTTCSPVTAQGFTALAPESGSEMVFRAPLMTWYKYKPMNMGPQLLAVPTKPGWSQLYWSNSGHMDRGIIWKVPLLKLLSIVHDHLTFRNALIDGDTYMVHVAERAMPVSGGIGISSASKLYYMPYSGDLAVVGLRKWLEQFGGDIPTCSPRDQPHMPPVLPYEQVLDRWTQHTKDCPHCKAGLALLDRVRSFCVALGALAGAAATAAAAAATSTAAATATAGASSEVTRLLFSAVACAVVVALCVGVHRTLGPWRRKFFYEEYIHALRD